MAASATRATLEHAQFSPRFEIDASAGQAGAEARPVMLLATSGSRSSIEATVFAAELAVAFNAVLRIVHVVSPVEFKFGRLAPTRAVQRRLADPFESPVLREARELAWRHGVAASVDLVAGEPAPEIVAAATRAQADLIVIGARGPAGLLRRTARTRRWVEAHAPCQVVTPALRSEPAPCSRAESPVQPQACTLSSEDFSARRALIGSLLRSALVQVTPLPDGVRASFAAGKEIEAELQTLVTLEAECCAFLSMTLHSSDDGVVLEVTGPSDARSLIMDLFAGGPGTNG